MAIGEPVPYILAPQSFETKEEMQTFIASLVDVVERRFQALEVKLSDFEARIDALENP